MPGSASACSRVRARPGTRASEPALIDGCLVIRQGVDADHDRPELSLKIPAEADGQEEALDAQPPLQGRQIMLLVLRSAGHPIPAESAPLEVRDRHALRAVIPGPGDPALDF